MYCAGGQIKKTMVGKKETKKGKKNTIKNNSRACASTRVHTGQHVARDVGGGIRGGHTFQNATQNLEIGFHCFATRDNKG